MSGRLHISLSTRNLERADADVAVAGFFSDHRPLRGGAARIDWRLCGLLSRLLMAGEIRGEPGEAILIPSSRHLRAPRILLLGHGSQRKYRIANAQDAMFDATARCIALGVDRIAMAPLGLASDDLPRHAQAIVGGAAEAMRGATRSLRLALTVVSPELERAQHALETAAAAIDSPALSIQPRVPATPPTARSRSASGAPSPSGSLGPSGHRAVS